MIKTRSDYRHQRRTLLKSIFDKLFTIQEWNDTELERIKILFFQNLEMDLNDIIKHHEHDLRMTPNNHIFVEKL
jgi:hypothetical protein